MPRFIDTGPTVQKTDKQTSPSKPHRLPSARTRDMRSGLLRFVEYLPDDMLKPTAFFPQSLIRKFCASSFANGGTGGRRTRDRPRRIVLPSACRLEREVIEILRQHVKNATHEHVATNDRDMILPTCKRTD